MPVVGDGEPTGLLGTFLLAFQGALQVLVGQVRGDDLEDVLAEDRQRFGVVLGGEGDEVGLGLVSAGRGGRRRPR